MYDNIGGKIKTWAVWIFIVEAIGAVIGGIAMIANDNGLIGFLTMVIGPFVAWVFSWLLYGFGQLIENSDIIAAEYSRKNEKHEKVVAQNIERKQADAQKMTAELVKYTKDILSQEIKGTIRISESYIAVDKMIIPDWLRSENNECKKSVC